MANWKEYTTKTTPEDADEIMIADSKANASKRTPFSGLWNWIANKLATAVISQLETQNKSIIPALNELNSNLGGVHVQVSINNSTEHILKITTIKNRYHFNGIIFSDKSLYVLRSGNPFLVSGVEIADIASTIVDDKNQITFTVTAWDEVTIISNRDFKCEFV